MSPAAQSAARTERSLWFEGSGDLGRGCCLLTLGDLISIGGPVYNLANWTKMRSSRAYAESGEPAVNGSLAAIPDAPVATPNVAALVVGSNIAAAACLNDETQPALPAMDEGFRDAARTIEGADAPLPEPQSQIEALTCANRRKDAFLALLSHELRSPLAAIHHAARFLRREAGEAATQEKMQALIERQLARMTHLVNELHDVSQIASGHLHLQRERIDLRDIVAHTIETLEWELQERHHQLAVELPDAPVWLRADPHRLEQVFVNLLANASRYTDDGGRVAVWVQSKDREAIIRIRDSGIGIAPDALPDIFDLFKQGNPADPRSGAGLGVGLAVVRNLVELHRGSVIAASPGVGQGSEFTVRLPTEE
jgi:signal transduction histidine kinase